MGLGAFSQTTQTYISSGTWTPAAGLPAGTYTVTYNLSGVNTATGSTSTMTVITAGVGTTTSVKPINIIFTRFFD